MPNSLTHVFTGSVARFLGNGARLWIILIFVGASFALACGSEDASGPEQTPSTLTTITVSPTTLTFTGLAEDATVVAQGLNQSGNQMSGVTFTWNSSDAVVATVTSTGVVTSVADGATLITASSGGVTSTPVTATVQTWVSLSAGGGHSCALTPADEAYCWGENSVGELGRYLSDEIRR